MRFIQRKSNTHEIINSSEDVVVCPADRKAKILSLYIYNPIIDPAPVSVLIEKDAQTPVLFFDTVIPPGDSHSLFSDNVYLEEGDKITVSTTETVHTIISFKEIKAI